MIIDKLEDYMLNKSAESYMKGNISLEEAAVRAKVSVWKMMDYLRENNITSPPETLEEIEAAFRRTEKILG